jgi:hypothetical protein
MYFEKLLVEAVPPFPGYGWSSTAGHQKDKVRGML